MRYCCVPHCTGRGGFFIPPRAYFTSKVDCICCRRHEGLIIKWSALHAERQQSLPPTLPFVAVTSDKRISRLTQMQSSYVSFSALPMTCPIRLCSVYTVANLTALVERRDQLCHNFFSTVLEPSTRLHHILPASRDPELLSRLRALLKYPTIPSWTKKYQSFISFALASYK